MSCDCQDRKRVRGDRHGKDKGEWTRTGERMGIYNKMVGDAGRLILEPRERAHHPHQPTPITGISRTLV